MVTFTLLVAPALRALGGRVPLQPPGEALLAHDYRKPVGRAHALRCRLHVRDGALKAEVRGSQGSHVLTSMLGADALAMIPSATEVVRAGERVEIELIGGRAPASGEPVDGPAGR